MRFRMVGWPVLGVVSIALLSLCACASLPDNSRREASRAIDDGDRTGLSKAFQRSLEDHPRQSGILLLSNGLDAFVGRAMLTRLAERSIDLQYYMFHQDTVGRLLIRELLDATDRGVRVRMLIDDMYGQEADVVWSALDAHPNVEVRMFNPFVRGRSKNLQFVTRMKTVNHRMHSKTYTVDNQISIVGGRNIGDEYFAADKELAFTDLDAMAIGPVVPDVSKEFDQYWNSEHAYPISVLRPAANAGALETLRRDLTAFSREKEASAYIGALEHSALAEALRKRSVRFSFADAKVIHDAPEKLAREGEWEKDLLISQLAPSIEQATGELIVVSPYFVPGKQGAAVLCGLSKKGVRVRILTNSLASNDVSAVHAGYSRHRKELLRCGVQLYELNEQIRKKEGERYTWLPGLSKSSLHAKTMAIDKRTMFVGSFNVDPRSLYINNEIGLLFTDPEVAANASKHFDENVDKVAFKVELSDEGSLRWTGTEDGKPAVFDSEPYAGFWKRLGANMLRILPIDSML